MARLNLPSSRQPNGPIVGFKRYIWTVGHSFPDSSWFSSKCTISGGQDVPRVSFIRWLSILGKLNIKDRISKWNPSTYLQCDFFGAAPETRDHLFFSCNFIDDIWRSVLTLIQLPHSTGDWHSEFCWAITHVRGKSGEAIVFCLAFTIHIYTVRRASNQKLFQNTASTSYTLVIKFDYEFAQDAHKFITTLISQA